MKKYGLKREVHLWFKSYIYSYLTIVEGLHVFQCVSTNNKGYEIKRIKSMNNNTHNNTLLPLKGFSHMNVCFFSSSLWCIFSVRRSEPASVIWFHVCTSWVGSILDTHEILMWYKNPDFPVMHVLKKLSCFLSQYLFFTWLRNYIYLFASAA